jgi:hypothetical protein
MMATLSPFSISSLVFLKRVRSWYPCVKLPMLSTLRPIRSAVGKEKERFFASNGFSMRPSSLIFSSCFSAEEALPERDPAESFDIRLSYTRGGALIGKTSLLIG